MVTNASDCLTAINSTPPKSLQKGIILSDKAKPGHHRHRRRQSADQLTGDRPVLVSSAFYTEEEWTKMMMKSTTMTHDLPEDLLEKPGGNLLNTVIT